MGRKFPLITAHTGCMDTPDNTIESALVGLESGADFIEVDVRSTKDKVAFLAHDYRIMSNDGKILNVYDLTLKELKVISRESNNEIALLDDVLDMVRSYDKRINLDLKGPFAAEAMVKSIKKMNVRDRVVISGCGYELVYYLKHMYPDLDFYLNADDFYFFEQFNEQNVRNALSASCIGINLEYQKCNPRLIEVAKENSLLISVWTVDDEDNMKKMIEMGVDSITTRNVPALLKLKNILG